MRTRGLIVLAALAACQGGGRVTDHKSATPDYAPAPLIDDAAAAFDHTPLGFALRSEYAPPGSDPVIVEAQGVTGVPLGVDVDADLTTGIAGADIRVQLTAGGTAHVAEIQRLGTAALPLRVLLRFHEAGPGALTAPQGALLELGYDAIAAGAPQSFRSAILVAPDLAGGETATLDIRCSGAGSELVALGAREDASRGTRLDIRAAMAPPPPSLQLSSRTGRDDTEYRLTLGAMTDLVVTLDEVGTSGLRQRETRLLGIGGSTRLHISDGDGTRFSFEASDGAAELGWTAHSVTRTEDARLAPLPTALTACFGEGATCGSHGGSTDASLSLYASAPVRLDFYSQRGREVVDIQDLLAHRLAVDLGASNSFARGHVWFDTDGTEFSGRIRSDSPDQGFRLAFPPGTWAEDRLYRWKNYVQTDRKSGQMRCPGPRDLDIKTGGEDYDADFLLDKLCA